MNTSYFFMMTIEELEKRLSLYLKKKLELTVKGNRRVFLHLLEKKKDRVRLSLHRLFLHSTEKILEAISRYVDCREKKSLIELQKFISEKDSSRQHESKEKTQKVHMQGNFYDLEEIFERLNARYFENQMKVKITWFSHSLYTRYSHVTLGSYNEMLGLIRINQILDDPRIPPYFLSYVVYHEMVHHVIPVEYHRSGRRNVHSKEFKLMEKRFIYYSDALAWEKNSLFRFLDYKKKGNTYGRT